MNENDRSQASLPRWMRSAVLTLSAIAIILASVFVLSISVIIPINLFVPGVGEVDAPEAVFILELVFLVLCSTGITGLFLRWVRKQTGTVRQHLQVLTILVVLIAVEIGIFTFFGMITHGACTNRTTSQSKLAR
jgi:hypothetical protein